MVTIQTNNHAYLDEVPGPVAFTATLDTDTYTSMYIDWSLNTPSMTHPLLLRYEILLNDTVGGVNLTFGPFLSSQTNYTVMNLETNTTYLVSMVATSLLGKSNAITQAFSTFSNRKPHFMQILSCQPQFTSVH